MDENARYLLHEELEGAPSAAPSSSDRDGANAAAAPTREPGAAAASEQGRMDDLLARLSQPEVLKALASLLGLR